MNMSESNNSWQTKSAKEVYDNPWIRVTHNEVITPTNQNGIYGKVSFKNLAIGIIPIDDQGFTWLVGQHRYTLDEYSWEIPMGGGVLKEDPLVSAQKELREETGITAKSWECIMKLHTSNSVTDEVGYVFVAKGLEMGPTDWDDTESLEIRHLPLQEAYTMVMDQKITDAISIAGLLKCKLLH